eukprot:gene5020-5678_t
MASKFDLEKFVQEQLKLIQLERTAEIEECTASRRVKNVKELEKRGVCISKLFPGAQCTGLYGKHLVTLLQKQRNFAKNSNKKENENLRTSEERVTANCFSNGDIVGLQLSNSDLSEENIASGVVTKVNDNSVTVAFEDSIDVSQCDMYRLIKLTNDVTYRRLKEALLQLKSDKNQAQHLKNILFHMTSIGPPLSAVNKETFVPFDKTLNGSQLEAVQFALNQRELGVIHGPPGTGKTTTVIEIIKQAVKKFDLKVLACAPSNVAVDNLVAKLTGEKIKLVRLGHPARVYSHLQKYSLDAALMNSDSAEVVQGVRNDISETLGKLRKARNDGEARKLKNELKYLKRELRERENKALKFVLSNANVILSTTTSSSMEGPLKHLENEHFDLLIIDEAAQALEASCWIALPYANKCILAGDHQQLPPTIISKEAAKKGLEVTLMERVIKEFGEPVVKMLTTQYRMHNDIMTWPSNELYNGKLVADESVSSHLLSGLPGVEATENTEIPLLFVDTAGCFMYELQEETEESKGNHYEVSIVEELVESLVSSGVKQEYIGVITPYNLQVELIRQALSSKYPKIEVRSVDGFQGREKEAIVMSLVRSNEQGEVGFLKEDRRLNVAITRARRHLAVVGDSQTISHHSFLKSFFEYAIEHGEVRSAHASCAQKTTTMLSHSSIETQAGGNDSLDDFDDLKFSLFSGANRKEIRKRTDIGKGNGKDFDRRNSKESSHGMVRNRVSLKENELASNVARSQTENDWPKVKEDIDNKIREFCSLSTERQFAFDSSLDAKARFYVHEVAERFGLVHKSTGEGKDRRICVKKASWKQTQENEAGEFWTPLSYVCIWGNLYFNVRMCNYSHGFISSFRSNS